MRKESSKQNTKKNLQLPVDTQEIDNEWRDDSTKESTERNKPNFIQASSVSGQERGASDSRPGGKG